MKPERAKDGRLRMAPPCEFGHRFQAMQCPSCAERVTGKVSSKEWRAWYERRYRKPKSKRASQSESSKGDR